MRKTNHVANNILVNDSRGFTPFEIINGFKYEDGFDRKMLEEVGNRLSKKEEAKVNLEKAREKQEDYYNKGKKSRVFEVGQWVMVRNGLKTKWNQDSLVGPYRIISREDRDNYVIYNHFLASYKQYNVSQIGEVVDVVNNKFGYVYDDERRDWKMSMMRGGDAARSVVGEKVLVDDSSRPVGAEVQEAEVVPTNNLLKSPVKSPVKNKINPIVGQRVSVYFESGAGKPRFHKGEVMAAKESHDEYLVRWDNQKKPQTVQLCPEDQTSDKDNDNRWNIMG